MREPTHDAELTLLAGLTVSGRERLPRLEGEVRTGEDLERAGEEVQETVGNWGSWGSTASILITSIVSSTGERGE